MKFKKQYGIYSQSQIDNCNPPKAHRVFGSLEEAEAGLKKLDLTSATNSECYGIYFRNHKGSIISEI